MKMNDDIDVKELNELVKEILYMTNYDRKEFWDVLNVVANDGNLNMYEINYIMAQLNEASDNHSCEAYDMIYGSENQIKCNMIADKLFRGSDSNIDSMKRLYAKTKDDDDNLNLSELMYISYVLGWRWSKRNEEHKLKYANE